MVGGGVSPPGCFACTPLFHYTALFQRKMVAKKNRIVAQGPLVQNYSTTSNASTINSELASQLIKLCSENSTFYRRQSVVYRQWHPEVRIAADPIMAPTSSRDSNSNGT